MPGDGKLTITYQPSSGGEAVSHTVYDFKGSGGVAMAMFNTDAVSKTTIFKQPNVFELR